MYTNGGSSPASMYLLYPQALLGQYKLHTVPSSRHGKDEENGVAMIERGEHPPPPRMQNMARSRAGSETRNACRMLGKLCWCCFWGCKTLSEARCGNPRRKSLREHASVRRQRKRHLEKNLEITHGVLEKCPLSRYAHYISIICSNLNSYSFRWRSGSQKTPVGVDKIRKRKHT